MLLQVFNFLDSLSFVLSVSLCLLVKLVLFIFQSFLQTRLCRLHFLDLKFNCLTVNEGGSILVLVENFHSFIRTLETIDLICLELSELLDELVTQSLVCGHSDQFLDVSLDSVCVNSSVPPQFWCECITVKRFHLDAIDHINLLEDVLAASLIVKEGTELVSKSGL